MFEIKVFISQKMTNHNDDDLSYKMKVVMNDPLSTQVDFHFSFQFKTSFQFP